MSKHLSSTTLLAQLHWRRAQRVNRRHRRPGNAAWRELDGGTDLRKVAALGERIERRARAAR